MDIKKPKVKFRRLLSDDSHKAVDYLLNLQSENQEKIAA